MKVKSVVMLFVVLPAFLSAQSDSCVVLGVQDLTVLAGALQYEVNSLAIQVDSLQQALSQLEGCCANEAYVPSYLKDNGDGSDGALILAGGESALLQSGEYSQIYVPLGAQLTLSPHSTTVVRCAGSVVIEGSIEGNGGNGAGGSGPYSNSVHLMSAGGAKGGGYVGDGDNWQCSFDRETGNIQNFSASTYFEVTGLGGALSNSLTTTTGALAVFPYLHGGDGGTSYYWSGSSVYCGRSGGQGAAGLYLIAENIDISGEIDLRGGNGQNCWQVQQGYNATGGGGGGRIVLASPNLNFTGTFDGSGGMGGGCSNTHPYAMSPASNGADGALILVEVE